MNKTYIIGSIAIAIIAAASVFFACSKEGSDEVTLTYKSGTKIEVGKYDRSQKTGEPTLEMTFDKEKYLSRLEQVLNKTENGDIVVEDVALYLDSVGEGRVYPMMKVSFFDLTNDYGYTTFFQLQQNCEKTANALGGITNLYVSDDEEGYAVCRGKNCGGGCFVLRDEKDRPYGCSECPTRKGECDSHIRVPCVVASILSAF